MKKCSNCGAVIDTNSTACAICGVSTNEEDFYSVYGIPKPNNANRKKAEKAKEEIKSETSNEHIHNKITDNTSVNGNNNKDKNNIKINTIAKESTDNSTSQNKDTKTQTTSDTISQATLHKIKSDKDETTEIKIQQNNLEEEIKKQEIEYSEIKENESFIKKIILILSPVKKIFFSTKDETSCYNKADIEENCHFALISYLMYFFFVPMIVKPYSGYLRFHGNQGLNLALFATGFEIINLIINFIISAVCTVDGILSGVGVALTVIVTTLINLTILLWIAIGIANAVKGKARELPVIGRFRILK